LIALLQRVRHASVTVDGVSIGAIDAGLLVFLCAEKGDTEREGDALLAKLLGYRVFGDAAGKMNRSVTDVAGGLLLVPQFTLAADTRSGTRPSFTPAAAPADVRPCGHAGPFPPCHCCHRPVWRRHASGADQRRPRDLLAPS
jgi:D-tyrosyl-tRNA(Tyr) deacylase